MPIKWESPKSVADKGTKWMKDFEESQKIKSQQKIEKIFPFLKK